GQSQKVFDGRETALDFPIALDDQFGVEGDIVLRERFLVPEIARVGRVPTGGTIDKADAPMPELDEMIHRELRAVTFVHANRVAVDVAKDAVDKDVRLVG